MLHDDDLEKIVDLLEEREEAREKTKREQRAPSSWLRRNSTAIGTVVAVLTIAGLTLAFLGDYIFMPKAEAVEIHTASDARHTASERRDENQDKHLRHHRQVFMTINENMQAIGDVVGAKTKPAPMPEIE